MSEMLGALVDEGEREFEEGLTALQIATAGMTHHNAYLSAMYGLINEKGLDRGQVCSLVAFASVLLIEARRERAYLAEEIADEEAECRRYRIAWHQARQRAQNHLAALVESDAERAHLAAQLRERDEDVRDLTNRLAEFCGITS